MEFIMNKQGEFELYDDTYDVVIHCDSEKARDEVLADLKAVNERLDILDKIRAEIENHCGLIKEDHCKYCGYCNSVMGVREILEIIDKYKAEE